MVFYFFHLAGLSQLPFQYRPGLKKPLINKPTEEINPDKLTFKPVTGKNLSFSRKTKVIKHSRQELH